MPGASFEEDSAWQRHGQESREDPVRERRAHDGDTERRRPARAPEPSQEERDEAERREGIADPGQEENEADEPGRRGAGARPRAPARRGPRGPPPARGAAG